MAENEDEVPVLEAVESFSSLNFDPRLHSALDRIGWKTPLPIQLSALPLALDGKDIVVQAASGSGKSAIFILPIIQSLLKLKDPTKTTRYPFALILSPTFEVALKTAKLCQKICKCCGSAIKCSAPAPPDVNSGKFSVFELRIPDILVMPPDLAQKCLNKYSPKFFRKLKFFVADEAGDLCNFQEQVAAVVKGLKDDSYQSIVVGSNISKQVLSIFKSLLPANLSVVRLLNVELPDKEQLKQFFISVSPHEKCKVLLALLKFDVLKGNCVIFCSSTKEAYKLKLFLKCFSCNCSILNSRLPVKSRKNALRPFLRGEVKLAITTDMACGIGPKKNSDSKFDCTRPIDFGEVPVIVNFSLPENPDVYIDRARMTARRFKKGTVLSFVGKSDRHLFASIQERLKSESGEKTIEKYHINRDEIGKLNYRVSDVMSNISNRAIRELEKEDIKEELLCNRQLMNYFSRKPRDLAFVKSISLDCKKRNNRLDQLEGVGDIPSYLKPSTRPEVELVTCDQLEQYKTFQDRVESGKLVLSSERRFRKSKEMLKRKNAQMSREMNEYYKTLGLRETGPTSAKKSKKI